VLDDLKDRLVNELYADIPGVDRTVKPRQRKKA
jgi:hypothetical protein